jgi:uracil-DNA glycosylase
VANIIATRCRVEEVTCMSRKAEWEKLKKRSAERFGEDSVFGEGSLNSRLALVGEAPGKQEVEESRPFVGSFSTSCSKKPESTARRST